VRTRDRRPRLRVERLEDRAVPATLYVATNGVNSTTGGTSASPWRTLQYAADHVQAGDTVVVRAGNYAGFYLDTSGTAAARITFSAESGVNITSVNPTTPDGINLEGASYVTVEGFTVNGMTRAGIRIVLNDHVIIRNNVCDLNGVWGILTGFSDDLLIENNVCSRSIDQHGIYVSNSGDRPVIRGNTLWGNHDNGLHMNGDIYTQPDGGGADGIISNALVENNVIYDNGTGGGSGINCDGVQNSVIRNNLIYNSHASGISLYRIDGGGSSTGNLVVNNTVLVASDGRWGLNISDASTGNTVRNNIFYSAQSFRGAMTISADSLSGFVSDYNIVEDRFTTDDGNTVLTLAQWRATTGQDSHSLTTADPSTLFVNAAAGDYHLKSGSAAIDKGTTTSAPPTDAEGTARPTGSGVDIGHDEFGGASPPPPSPPPPPPPPPPPVTSGKPFAVGSDPGQVAKVTMYNADRTVRFAVNPFGTYTGGVRVAVGDVTGDGVADVVVGTSGAGTGRARVINGATHALTQLFGGTAYTGTVSVAVGDVTGDGVADIALGTNEQGARVQVFRGGTFAKLADFHGGGPTNFKNRTQVALADLNADGRADLAVTAMYTTDTRVFGYSGTSLRPGVTPTTLFTRLSLSGAAWASGIFLAAGDVSGDGFADLVLGSGAGSAPRVIVYSGKSLVQNNTAVAIADFAPVGSSSATGVRVGVRDIDGDGKLDLLTASGDLVTALKGGSLPATGRPPQLFAFDPDATHPGGVWVG
jgi:parallel beta-helix repeat protein